MIGIGAYASAWGKALETNQYNFSLAVFLINIIN